MVDSKEENLMVSTQKQLSEVFGVSVRTIHRWLLEGMPKKTADGYDVNLIAKWRGISLDDEPDGITEDSNTKAYWDIQFRKWRALYQKVLYEREKCLLMPIKEFEERITEILMSLASNLAIYEDRLPPQLEGKTKQEMRDIIHRENNHFRMQYEPQTI